MASAEGGDLVLEPSSEWKLREYSDKCRVSRVFGSGDEQTTLWIDQGGKEPSYNVTFIGDPLGNPYGRAVEIQFGEEKPSLRNYIQAKSSKGRPVITMFGVALSPPEIEFEKPAEIVELRGEQLKRITKLKLSRSIRRPLSLELGPMDAPLEFLRGCAEQIEISLKRASRSSDGKARPPHLTNEGVLTRSIEYPSYLLRSRMEARIVFRLTVNDKGKPTGCFISETNRPQLFDDAVCLGLLRHAKFTPALNTEGKPVASYYYSSISYIIK